MNEQLPRVLIISPVPFNNRMTSRFLDSYFHDWPKENLRHIFSHPKIPIKGHCDSLYQITDERLLKSFFNHSYDPGIIYNYNDLPSEWNKIDLDVENNVIRNIYTYHHDTSVVYFLRRKLWNKKRWYTSKLKKWISDFNPEIILCVMSNHFFTMDMSLFLSEEYDIPIIPCILDDYFFTKSNNYNLLYKKYKREHSKIYKKIFSKAKTAIYVSEKMKEKYNDYFKVNGEVIYFGANTCDCDEKIEKDRFAISYFGNINLGRYKTIIKLAREICKIDSKYKIFVYTNQQNQKYIKFLSKEKNIVVCHSLSYKDVLYEMKKSGFLLLVEDFERKYLKYTEYSLSTKVADSLLSGTPLIVAGNSNTGLLDYFSEKKFGLVIDELSDMNKEITVFFEKDDYSIYIKNAIEDAERKHNLEINNLIFKKIVKDAI